MKKFIVILTVLVMALFAGNTVACGQGGGLTGLEISGGSAIGAQGYIGTTWAHSSHDSCFSQARTLDRTGYIGATLMTSANGAASLKTRGNAKGSVNGYGNFKAGISGEAFGAEYYTNSKVHISGGAY